MYLAPALVIINAEEFRNLTQHVSSIIDRKYQYIVLEPFQACKVISSNLNPAKLNYVRTC